MRFSISLKNPGPAYKDELRVSRKTIYERTVETHTNELGVRYAEHRWALLEARGDVGGEVLVWPARGRGRGEFLVLIGSRVKDNAEVIRDVLAWVLCAML